MVGRSFHNYGSSRKALPEVWNWSGDPPGGQELVGWPSRRSVTGREALLEVQNWLRDPPNGLELFRRLTRRSKKGRDTLKEIRKWSKDPLEGLEVVGNRLGGPGLVRRPYRRSGNGR